MLFKTGLACLHIVITRECRNLGEVLSIIMLRSSLRLGTAAKNSALRAFSSQSSAERLRLGKVNEVINNVI